MDALSVFHILIGLAEKALSAPPNFDEMRQAIFDITSEKQAALLKQIDIANLDLSQEMQRPGSEAQRKWNSFMVLIFAFHVAMQEYYAQAANILERSKNYEDIAFAIQKSLEELARSRDIWDQAMLDDEQRRMIALLELYQQQSQALMDKVHHIASLREQLTEINTQIMHHADTIQRITSERMEQVENIVNSSSNSQLNLLDNVTLNLNRLLSENTQKLNDTQQQLTRTDLTGQQHEELVSKAAEYQDKVTKYARAVHMTELYKDKIIDKQHNHQNLRQSMNDKMEIAKDSGNPLLIMEAAQAATLEMESYLIQNSKSDKGMLELFEDLKSTLPAESTQLLEDLSSKIQEDAKLCDEKLKAVIDHKANILSSTLTKLDELSITSSKLQIEIKDNVKESNQLEVNVMRLKRDMTGYNNRHNISPPSPTNNNILRP